MTVCTPQHAARLKALHAKDPNFGVIGNLWAPRVAKLMWNHGYTSLLDYGCGRSGLAAAVKREWPAYPPEGRYAFSEYDPATMPGTPSPADLVTNIDVLEHVEADCLNAVVADIYRCMNKAGLITISLRNARKNSKTHPNVHPRHWWKARLQLAFVVDEIEVLDPKKAESELACIVMPLMYPNFDFQ